MKAQRSQSWALIRAKWLFAQVVDPLQQLPPPLHRHPLHAAALDKKLKSLEPWAWNLQLIVSHTHTRTHTHSLTADLLKWPTWRVFAYQLQQQQQQHFHFHSSNNNNACLLSRIALFKFVFRKYLRDARFLFRIFFLTFLLVFLESACAIELFFFFLVFKVFS